MNCFFVFGFIFGPRPNTEAKTVLFVDILVQVSDLVRIQKIVAIIEHF